jgi:hypothetical protein
MLRNLVTSGLISSLTTISLSLPANAGPRPINPGFFNCAGMEFSSDNCVAIIRRANIFRPQKDCDTLKGQYPSVKVVRIALVPFCAIPAKDSPKYKDLYNN